MVKKLLSKPMTYPPFIILGHELVHSLHYFKQHLELKDCGYPILRSESDLEAFSEFLHKEFGVKSAKFTDVKQYQKEFHKLLAMRDF